MSQSLDLALVKFWKNVIPPRPVLVAVSGGPDSLALLHALHYQTLQPATHSRPRFPTLRLEVAHFNHRIRGEAADLDARFVEKFCKERAIPFHLGQFDVPAFASAHSLSIEDAARQTRYAWLSNLAANRKIWLILTGHNADDQAETLLLRLLRGTGPHGLAGIPEFGPLPTPHPALLPKFPNAGSTDIRLGRPFLSVWRTEIEAYITENGLEPRQDATNSEDTYARNRVRLRLLPLLEKEYQPQIKANLARLAGLTREDEDWLYYVVEGEFEKNVQFEFGCQFVFKKDWFSKRPLALQKRLIRRAAEGLGGLQNLDAAHIDAVIKLFEAEDAGRFDLPGKLVAFSGKGGVGLLSVPEAVPWSAEKVEIPVPGELSGPGNRWKITARLVKNSLQTDFLKAGNAYHVWLDYAKINSLLQGSVQPHAPSRLQIRSRQPGERYRPLGGPGQRKVQDIMLDAGIPRELRQDWPLLVRSGNTEQPDVIAWIPGTPIAHDFRVTPDTEQILELSFEFGTTPHIQRYYDARNDSDILFKWNEIDYWLENNQSGKE